MAAPFKVKSIYEYTSEHDDDLSFPIGQVITVVELEGDDWYVGEYTDASGSKQEGLFPTNFVEKYEPEVPVRPSRPPRAKQEIPQPVQPAQPAQPAPAQDLAEEEAEEEEAPPLPAASKPAPPAEEVPAEEVRSPPSATSQKSMPIRQQEPPSAPKPTPAEPAEPVVAPAKKAPPPVASKSNAFKDRIAAFNAPAAAPLAPMQPGRKPEPNFIKKPFVAPPPSKNAYIPPVTKQEPIHKPYHRDEDPEIKQREEEDKAAAEAAGFGGEQAAAPAGQGDEEEDDAPKPLTLKERMALLQKQQQEQAQRRAESAPKKEKKPPTKRPSESSEQVLSPEDEQPEGLERSRSTVEKKSMDVSPDMPPPVPSASRRPPEPMSPSGPELSSDGHEADQSGAGEMTEDDSGTLGPDKDEDDERSTEALRHPVAPRAEPDMGDQQDTTEDDEDEEEDEMDEETRRKEELRARMARLGGGGMPGMGGPFNPFGAPPPAPPRKKASKDRKASEDTPVSPQPQRAPMVPIPGMGVPQRVQSPDSDTTQRVQRDDDEVPTEEDDEPLPPPPKRMSTMDRAAPPPVPKDSRPLPPPPSQDRPVPPPPTGGVTPRPPAPDQSRPVPPPPPAAVPMSPGPGSESDDEASMHAQHSSADMSGLETPQQQPPAMAPPVPGSRVASREVPPRPPQSPESKRASYFNNDPSTDKRASRPPPPIPGGDAVTSPTSPRPPPPPPPTAAPPSRQGTMDERDEDERMGSDYDGDYDTDIASSAKQKDSLKASPHVREPSLTDNIPTGEETPVSSPPPLPQASAPRAVPPPPPQVAPPKTRASMDRPPPPVPMAQDASADPDYDPYRYESPQQQRAAPPQVHAAPRAVPPVPPVQEPETLQEESSADDMYPPEPPPRQSMDRAPPQPPPQAPLAQAPTRASLDAPRALAGARRSMEQGRPSGEHSGQIANELNLSQDTPWWTAEQPLPPNLQSRNGIDILSECEESSKSKRGGRKEITKDIYILYLDYSQTVISARYDSQDPADVHLEQRHESPPARMRQDQLEAAWQRFGTKIADAAAQVGNSKKSGSVADGTPADLPLALIRAYNDALLPVGTRAYGALVYANLANASTMQYDEIRRGDILTLRNARFEGHHGAMKSKYKADYGGSHVAVVEEWDGTRRAVRAWEQGREGKGKGTVRSEKFRLGDLRSGEVRVWRVVGREWVGWDS